MNVFAVFLFAEIVPLIPPGRVKKGVRLSTPNHGEIRVKVGGLRMNCIASNPTCVKCGKQGIIWSLESTKMNERPHLNLYADLGDQPLTRFRGLNVDGLVLMTIDHLIPRSKNGKDDPSNVVSMCSICNAAKGNQLDPTIPKPVYAQPDWPFLHEVQARLKAIGIKMRPIKNGGAVLCRSNADEVFVWTEHLSAIMKRIEAAEAQVRWTGADGLFLVPSDECLAKLPMPPWKED